MILQYLFLCLMVSCIRGAGQLGQEQASREIKIGQSYFLELMNPKSEDDETNQSVGFY